MTEILRCVSVGADPTLSEITLQLIEFCLIAKIYTYEMKIIKVVPGDAGGYRCEVSAKDVCDSSTFEISVEGEWKWTPAH